MNAFKAALRIALRDPNLSAQAEYWPADGGRPVQVRVMLATPDQMMNLGDAVAVTADAVVLVPVADFPQPPDGVFIVAGDAYEALAAMRDEMGVSWRVTCRRTTEANSARVRLRNAAQ